MDTDIIYACAQSFRGLPFSSNLGASHIVSAPLSRLKGSVQQCSVQTLWHQHYGPTLSNQTPRPGDTPSSCQTFCMGPFSLIDFSEHTLAKLLLAMTATICLQERAVGLGWFSNLFLRLHGAISTSKGLKQKPRVLKTNFERAIPIRKE